MSVAVFVNNMSVVVCKRSVSRGVCYNMSVLLSVLQVRQFEGMLSPLLSPPLPSLPNSQMAWAALAVEELTRLGVATFAVAPGEAWHCVGMAGRCVVVICICNSPHEPCWLLAV
jgi:hypothetical protein